MRVLSAAEVQQLLAVLHPKDPFGARDRAMLQLALHTGLRVSELCGLSVDHVAHEGEPRRTLLVSGKLGKGGRERIIPLNATARQAIADILRFNQVRGFSVQPSAPLLVTKRHEALYPRAAQRLMARLSKAAGLDVPARPHTLRHSFATRLAHKSGQLMVVKNVLGHKRLNTVQIYMHPDREQTAQALDTIG